MFYDTLPTTSKSNNIKKRNLLLNMKTCPDEKSYYRFRLLAFNPPAGSGSDRDYPFIQRFMHIKWGTNPEKGYPMIVDEITCPVTPHVHVEGNRYNACKMCDIANKYFVNFKESGWKDKEAAKKNKEFGRKFQGIIPVYVVNDPNYEGNNNKFKVIMFGDKKQYDDFCDKVRKQQMKAKCFNGENAVDCCIHLSDVEERKNEGQPNEYVWKHRVIDKIVFSSKPYDIPSINQQTVQAMGFDDEYYTTSTPEQIEAFYKKWCTVSNDDIPDEEESIPVYDEPVKTPVKKQETLVPVMTNDDIQTSSPADITTDELDELTADIDNDKSESNSPAESTSTPNEKSDDAAADELSDLLDGIDI